MKINVSPEYTGKWNVEPPNVRQRIASELVCYDQSLPARHRESCFPTKMSVDSNHVEPMLENISEYYSRVIPRGLTHMTMEIDPFYPKHTVIMVHTDTCFSYVSLYPAISLWYSRPKERIWYADTSAHHLVLCPASAISVEFVIDLITCQIT